MECPTYDSVPAGLALVGSDVIVVGGNSELTPTATTWRCAAVAFATSSGNTDSSFGTLGIKVFTPNTANDCILNGVAPPPSGSDILVVGTAYNGSNYDALAAKLNSAGQSDTQRNGGIVSKFATSDGTYTTLTQDSWTATSTGANVLAARYLHNTVWTGSEMIVWGGTDGPTNYNDGAIYDPVADSWSPTTSTNAPSVRYQHSGVWTGAKMIIWGGQDNVPSYPSTGGQYDPYTDSWVATTTTSAPIGRANPTNVSVWTGAKMILWGGGDTGPGYTNAGGVYTP